MLSLHVESGAAGSHILVGTLWNTRDTRTVSDWRVLVNGF